MNTHIYRELFLVSRDPLLIIQCDNKQIVEANRAASDLLGLSVNRLKDVCLSDFFTDIGFLDGVFEVHRDFVPLRYLRKTDARHIPVELSVRYFSDTELISPPNPRGECAAIAIRDISERINRHRNQIAEDKKYKSLFEASPYPIVMLTEQGKISEINLSAQLFYGYEADELIGQSWHQLEAEGTAVSFHAKPTVLAATRHQKKSGELFLAEVVLSYFVLGGQKMVLALIRDVTELADMLNKLTESESRWRFGVEGHGDALVDWSPQREDGSFFVSPRLSQILGFDPSSDMQLKKADWLARIVPVDLVLIEQAIEDYLSGKTDDVHAQFRMFTEAGTHRWLSLRAKSISPYGQANPRLIGSIRDIHLLRQRKKQDQANREKMFRMERLGTAAEMMSAIAHEVNQPLAAIANYSALCQRILAHEANTNNPLSELLREMNGQALRAGEIVRKMRGLIRRGKIEPSAADFNALIERVIAWSKPHLEASGIMPILSLSPSLPAIEIDVIQIEQVVFNLVRNAIEAMHDEQKHQPRTLIIRTEQRDANLTMTLQDHGEGLGQFASSEEIFQPFVSRKANGMGMGLAISKSIIEAHGGHLSACSQKKADSALGTQFTLSLPIGLAVGAQA